MDRVICGDVGFGKTEVALRAAAAVVPSGKQVAVAPTVLARQHVATFRKRFAPFNIQVGSLSRAASAAETREAKEGLKSGKSKVVIGTQALASKDVRFADLGSVIIDEEQHFGAAEKAKPFRTSQGYPCSLDERHADSSDARDRSSGLQGSQRHCLAPRSSSSGAHEGRSAFGCCYCIGVVARAEASWAKLLDLFAYSGPRPDVGACNRWPRSSASSVSTGKLPVDEIDERMMSFVEGATDVLLATNIVESGLDIPRANTIVVCWPERFGLAQLHQLRGRVGRGGIRAFACLLTDSGAERSEKRLAVLEEFNRPGGGFAISARDLDVRGAGDLLSERQSGHVQVLGPVLYSHLLQLASEKADGRTADMWVPDLNLPGADMLPASYLESEAVRLEIYAPRRQVPKRR
jgi:transcription-repair coupling factor (superfamily II helicase)